MNRVEELTTAQSIEIYPRYYSVGAENLSMKVREDGSGTEETITDISIVLNENTITLEASYSILKEDRTYSIEVSDNDKLWYRGKLICSSQEDKDKKYTLNTNKYTEVSRDDKYIVLDE